jgi:hypothetical protein
LSAASISATWASELRWSIRPTTLPTTPYGIPTDSSNMKRDPLGVGYHRRTLSGSTMSGQSRSGGAAISTDS